MEQRANILLELKELDSTLGAISPLPVYVVPSGYFEGLIPQVLMSIRASEARSTHEELKIISPLLAGISKEMPNHIPGAYFEELQTGMNAMIADNDQPVTATDELENLSPLLAGLKKDMPYHVPQGYFENNPSSTSTIEDKSFSGKVVSLNKRTWFRYAAAAMLAGIVATTIFFASKRNTIDPNKDSYAWVNKNLKPVSTDAIEQFNALTEQTPVEKDAIATARPIEVKELIKDISDKELQQFLEEIPADDATGIEDENTMLN